MSQLIVKEYDRINKLQKNVVDL